MMQGLDEKEWKSFILEKLAGIDSGQDIYASERVTGDVPYITSGTSNNGIGYFVGNDNKSKAKGSISVARNGAVGEAFYHPYEALYGNDCRRVTLFDTDSEYANHFVAASITQQKKMFSYSRKLGTERLKHLKIMLPIDDIGEPDYAYMEQYVSDLRSRKIEKYKNYTKVRISKLGNYVEIPALSDYTWSEFRIGDLFTISRPVARNKDSYKHGDVPFVASGAVNNGVMKLCAPVDDEELDAGNCITVSPVDGSTFYQPMDFLGRGGAGSSILILRADFLNEYVGEFVARCVQQTTSKYTYGHMGNKDSIKRERIMLPVDDDGELDYAYMEQYSKNMMLQKYQQYLKFLERENKI